MSTKSKGLLSCFLLATTIVSGGFARANGVARLDLGGAWQVNREGDERDNPRPRARLHPYRSPGSQEDSRSVLSRQRETRAMGRRGQLALSPIVRRPARTAFARPRHAEMRRARYPGNDPAQRHARWRGPTTCSAPTIRRQETPQTGRQHDRNRVRLGFAADESQGKPAEAAYLGLSRGRATCGRSLAISAGTGGRPWSPAESGGKSGSKRSTWPGWMTLPFSRTIPRKARSRSMFR